MFRHRQCIAPQGALQLLKSIASATSHRTFPRLYSSNNDSSGLGSQKEKASISSTTSSDNQPKQTKTQSELDKELQLKMQGLAGDGGESGIEYEDGQPVSMKRSVKNNMFRYI